MVEQITIILTSLLDWVGVVFNFLIGNELTRLLILVPFCCSMIILVITIIFGFLKNHNNSK